MVEEIKKERGCIEHPLSFFIFYNESLSIHISLAILDDDALIVAVDALTADVANHVVVGSRASDVDREDAVSYLEGRAIDV